MLLFNLAFEEEYEGEFEEFKEFIKEYMKLKYDEKLKIVNHNRINSEVLILPSYEDYPNGSDLIAELWDAFCGAPRKNGKADALAAVVSNIKRWLNIEGVWEHPKYRHLKIWKNSTLLEEKKVSELAESYPEDIEGYPYWFEAEPNFIKGFNDIKEILEEITSS